MKRTFKCQHDAAVKGDKLRVDMATCGEVQLTVYAPVSNKINLSKKQIRRLIKVLQASL